MKFCCTVRTLAAQVLACAASREESTDKADRVESVDYRV